MHALYNTILLFYCHMSDYMYFIVHEQKYLAKFVNKRTHIYSNITKRLHNLDVVIILLHLPWFIGFIETIWVLEPW